MNKKHQIWFDHFIGIENSGLLNGIVYAEAHRMGNEKTKFFLSPDFLPGSVVYNNQSFFDLKIKYNVYDDNVLLKLPSRLGGATLILVKKDLESFTIQGRDFMKVLDSDSKGSIPSGFYEVSFKSPFFMLFTKYAKDNFERKDKGIIYHEFPNRENKYFLHYNENYYAFNGKKDLANLFPKHKKEIYSFYNTAKSLRKSNPQKFILALMNQLDTSMFENDKEVKE